VTSDAAPAAAATDTGSVMWTGPVRARVLCAEYDHDPAISTQVLTMLPGAYLTRWRMDLAARRLRDTGDSLDAIAASVGYSSGYAFSRAFRCARSQPPGQFRAGRAERGPEPNGPALAAT